MRRVVSFHYTLRDPSGRVLDSSAGGEPITFLEGAGHIIEGLEEQLRGVSVDEKRHVTVPAAKAYGERDPAQVQRVSRGLLPCEGELRVGDQFRTGPDRHAPVVTVVGIEGDEVLLDANHPLAGVDLTFDVQVTGSREPTMDELESGQVNRGECGCGDDCGCGEGDCGCDDSKGGGGGCGCRS